MSDDWQARSNDIALHGYRGAKGQDATAALLAEKAALESQNQALQERIDKTLRRDFAAEEDIATIDELTPLQAYERGVVDVQEYLLSPTQETDPE